jgi:hypothetical protein
MFKILVVFRTLSSQTYNENATSQVLSYDIAEKAERAVLNLQELEIPGIEIYICKLYK